MHQRVSTSAARPAIADDIAAGHLLALARFCVATSPCRGGLQAHRIFTRYSPTITSFSSRPATKHCGIMDSGQAPLQTLDPAQVWSLAQGILLSTEHVDARLKSNCDTHCWILCNIAKRRHACSASNARKAQPFYNNRLSARTRVYSASSNSGLVPTQMELTSLTSAPHVNCTLTRRSPGPVCSYSLALWPLHAARCACEFYVQGHRKHLPLASRDRTLQARPRYPLWQ